MTVPAASVLNEIQAEKVYIACGYTDMRRSIDGLAATVKQVFKLDPCARTMYLFCGKNSKRLKALLWEGDGFLLLYKRLETDGRFRWPRKESEARMITPQQLRWLLEGLSIEQPKALRRVETVLVV
jgi:transposase